MNVRARIEAIEQRVKHLAQAEGSRCPTCGGFGPSQSCVIMCDADGFPKSHCPTCKWRVDGDGKAYPCDRVPAKGKVYVKTIILHDEPQTPYPLTALGVAGVVTTNVKRAPHSGALQQRE